MVNRSPNMWTLIGLGTSAAFIYSVVAKVAPEVFPDTFLSMGRIAVYFEAAVVIISLTLFGQFLEVESTLADLCGYQVVNGVGSKDSPAYRG